EPASDFRARENGEAGASPPGRAPVGAPAPAGRRKALWGEPQTKIGPSRFRAAHGPVVQRGAKPRRVVASSAHKAERSPDPPRFGGGRPAIRKRTGAQRRSPRKRGGSWLDTTRPASGSQRPAEKSAQATRQGGRSHG